MIPNLLVCRDACFIGDNAPIFARLWWDRRLSALRSLLGRHDRSGSQLLTLSEMIGVEAVLNEAQCRMVDEGEQRLLNFVADVRRRLAGAAAAHGETDGY